MFARTPYRIVFTILLASGLLLQACSRAGTNTAANPPTVSSSIAAKPTTSPPSAFERDLQFVRNGQYSYIWIFSRKDGKPLDKDDGAYLRTNAPQVVDWIITDEGRRAIGGTNFNLELGNMDLLKKRFVVEDYTGK